MEFIIITVLALVIIAVVILNIKIVPQSKAYVIERLGTYSATWQTGLHIKIPFIERIAKNPNITRLTTIPTIRTKSTKRRIVDNGRFK